MGDNKTYGQEGTPAKQDREFVQWGDRSIEYIPEYEYDARYKILVQPYNSAGQAMEVLADVKAVDGKVEVDFDCVPNGVSEAELKSSLVRHLVNPEHFLHFSEGEDAKGDSDYQFSIEKQPVMLKKPVETDRTPAPWII
jgi:hypothetical protein